MRPVESASAGTAKNSASCWPPRGSRAHVLQVEGLRVIRSWQEALP